MRRALLVFAATLALGCVPASADPCATEKEMLAMSAYEYAYSFGMTISACDRKFGSSLMSALIKSAAALQDDPIANGGLQSYAQKLGLTTEQLQGRLDHSVEMQRINNLPENFPNDNDCARLSGQIQSLRWKAGADDAGRLDLRFARQQGHLCQ
jgi:hypothetical protein